MFTEKFMEEMEAPFQVKMRRLEESGKYAARAMQIRELVHGAEIFAGGAKAEAEALKCLYASMPLSDALDYTPELFCAYARHGVFLWEKGPFAGRVPEKLFAGYVLHHRVNNEDLTENRPLFFDKMIDKIKGTDMEKAVLAVNYWCASQVTYRATDDRTASPLCVYNSGFGRCGEESAFTVSVLRSVGIPARQVYAPWWSHCDDNHAWVEAWCDGKWSFLGACEPEERLNAGWFNGAASRAMLVRSRWMLPAEPDWREGEGGEEMQALPGPDMCTVLDHLGRYARTAELKVSVHTADGRPAAGAKVEFAVLNGAAFVQIASLRTDEEGKCRFLTGIGSLLVTAFGGGLCGECLMDTGSGAVCEITLGKTPWKEEIRSGLRIHAPEDFRRSRAALTEEEKRRGREKLGEMNRLRREKEKELFDTELAERVTAGLEVQTRERWMDIMKKARGNQRKIADFLLKPTDGLYPEECKLRVLETLGEKDYRDITGDVLEESCEAVRDTCAPPLASGEAMWDSYVLCPRVWNETLRPFRRKIFSWLEKEGMRQGRNLAEEIRRDPSAAYRLVKERIKLPEKDRYDGLTLSGSAALESGYGDELTRSIACVQILRTLGIPSRLNPADWEPEVWEGFRPESILSGDFESHREERPHREEGSHREEKPHREEKFHSEKSFESGADWEKSGCGSFVPLREERRNCLLILTGQESVEWRCGENWSLARYGEEDSFPLRFEERELLAAQGKEPYARKEFVAGKGLFIGKIELFPGKYRLITSNRLPNGNVLINQILFELREGESREICLEMPWADPSEMLSKRELVNFALKREDGTKCLLSELVRSRGGVFLWLGEEEEPTEHILNEIFQRKEEYEKTNINIYFVVKNARIREVPAFRRVWEALPEAELLLDGFGSDMETLARSMYLEPGKLPLIVIADRNLTGIYGAAGYNVGTGDMILKMLGIAEL